MRKSSHYLSHGLRVCPHDSTPVMAGRLHIRYRSRTIGALRKEIVLCAQETVTPGISPALGHPGSAVPIPGATLAVALRCRYQQRSLNSAANVQQVPAATWPSETGT